ncbi:MAG: hypothetical protein PUA53_03445 [Chlamydia suis]|nr:hypothetical protein [Chlamydia suis]
MFVSFDKSCCRDAGPDFLEKTGNFFLHSIARGMNGLYRVKKIPNHPSYGFSHTEVSCCQRIVNIVVCLLTGPLMLLAAVLGLLAYKFSSTYQTSLHDRLRYQREQKQALETYRGQEQRIVTLQKFCRGFLVRNHLLNQKTYLKCKNWGWNLLLGGKYPRVLEGRSLVYTSKQYPSLIAKHVGISDARSRWHNIFSMRKVLAQLDIKRLHVPRARVFKEVLFEERLPVSIYVDSMCLYKENPEAFDEAIKELLFLFKKVHCRDLVAETDAPTDNFPLALKVQERWLFPRYDNLPLFIQEGEGRIALVDLETFSWDPHPCPVEELAVMFPMHKNLLITEAEKLHIPFSKKEVENSIKKGQAFFNHVLGHQEFCKKKNVSLSRNCAPYITPEAWRFSIKIFETLKSAVQPGSPFLGTLSSDAQERLTSFSDKQWMAFSGRVTSSLLEKICLGIYQIHNQEKQQVCSEGTFLLSRSPILLRQILLGNLPQLLSAKLGVLPNEGNRLACLCLHAVMKELVATGDLYDYDPMEDFLGGEYCRIRY